MDWLLPAAGAIVVLGGAAATLRGAWRISGRVHRIADEILGTEKRPGYGDRLDQIERRLAKVEGQVNPNGGKSMADRVIRIAAATGADPEGQEHA